MNLFLLLAIGIAVVHGAPSHEKRGGYDCRFDIRCQCTNGGSYCEGENRECVNRVCVCVDGYVETNGECISNPSCENGGTVCPAGRICNQQKRVCECPPGTVLVNEQCADKSVTPCEQGGLFCSDSNSHCIPLTNNRGSGRCDCNEGFIMINGVCTPITEVPCSDGGSVCRGNYVCENRVCICPAGYQEKGNDCYSITTPCIEGGLNCEDENSYCIPLTQVVGSGRCDCNQGYIKFNGVCRPITEVPCSDGGSGCRAGYVCENRLCICPPGYQEGGNGCYSVTTPCTEGGLYCADENSFCIPQTHVVGSGVCQCNEGYIKVNGVCRPITEVPCSDGGSVCRGNYVCENRVCICPAGYQERGNDCYSVTTPCTEGGLSCVDENSYCIPLTQVVGSGRCDCNQGYIMVNGVCRPITEVPCSDGGSVCRGNYVCENRVCICPAGYQEKGYDCYSVTTPCSEGGLLCVDKNSYCIPLTQVVGSGRCDCNRGYIMVNGICKPRTEVPCQEGGVKCGERGTCNEGTRQCVCEEGYVWDEFDCVKEFNPVDYCTKCVSIRNGPGHYPDPFDCSSFYQCTGNSGDAEAFHLRCAACTYWNQEKLACVQLSEAQCPERAPAKSQFALDHSCCCYVQCGEVPEEKCCPGNGYGFSYGQQACVSNGCSDSCQPLVTQSTTWSTPVVTQPSGDYCTLVYLPLNEDFKDTKNNYVDPAETKLADRSAYFQGFNTIEIPLFTNMYWGDEMTISFWYRTDMAAVKFATRLVSNGDCDGFGTVSIWMEEDTLQGAISTTDNADVKVTKLVIDHNAWHHVVMTYDGKTLRLYVDGELTSSAMTTGNIRAYPAPLQLSTSYCEGESEFQWYIDEVKVMKCAVTASEVDALYSQGR